MNDLRYQFPRLRIALFVAMYLLGLVALAAADSTPSIYKTSRLDERTVLLSCKDGSMPKVKQMERFVVVNCDGAAVTK